MSVECARKVFHRQVKEVLLAGPETNLEQCCCLDTKSQHTNHNAKRRKDCHCMHPACAGKLVLLIECTQATCILM